MMSNIVNGAGKYSRPSKSGEKLMVVADIPR